MTWVTLHLESYTNSLHDCCDHARTDVERFRCPPESATTAELIANIACEDGTTAPLVIATGPAGRYPAGALAGVATSSWAGADILFHPGLR